MREKLFKQGWSVVEEIPQDASTRKYTRLEKGEKTAILMEDGGAKAVPRVDLFCDISSWIRNLGLHAPQVYEVNEQRNVMLLEDLGGISFRRACEKENHDVRELYEVGVEALRIMVEEPCSLKIAQFTGDQIDVGHRDIFEWYFPLVARCEDNPGLIEEYHNVWAEITDGLPKYKDVFVHGDYHAENLHWLAKEAGLSRCGIIDFQDARFGPAMYDLGNFLEDPRHKIPCEIRRDSMKVLDEVDLAWYRVLTTKFHLRALAFFIRMVVQNNRQQYRVFIPQTLIYIQEGLKSPLLKPLKHFFSDLALDFTSELDLNGAKDK